MRPSGCSASGLISITCAPLSIGRSIMIRRWAWPLFVEMDLCGEGRTRYSQVLALLSDSLPRGRVGRFWEAIAAYDSTRQCDRARYAADLAAAMYSATSDIRAHYYALMQIAF